MLKNLVSGFFYNKKALQIAGLLRLTKYQPLIKNYCLGNTTASIT